MKSFSDRTGAVAMLGRLADNCFWSSSTSARRLLISFSFLVRLSIASVAIICGSTSRPCSSDDSVVDAWRVWKRE